MCVVWCISVFLWVTARHAWIPLDGVPNAAVSPTNWVFLSTAAILLLFLAPHKVAQHCKQSVASELQPSAAGFRLAAAAATVAATVLSRGHVLMEWSVDHSMLAGTLCPGCFLCPFFCGFRFCLPAGTAFPAGYDGVVGGAPLLRSHTFCLWGLGGADLGSGVVLARGVPAVTARVFSCDCVCVAWCEVGDSSRSSCCCCPFRKLLASRAADGRGTAASNFFKRRCWKVGVGILITRCV